MRIESNGESSVAPGGRDRATRRYDSPMDPSVRGWLIAIGLAGGIASLVLVLQRESDPRPRGALEVHAESVGIYADVKGRLPTSIHELLQIDPRVNEPFLERIPKNQWGRDYWVEILDPQDGRFRVGSDGADGIRGTADDRTLDSRWARRGK